MSTKNDKIQIHFIGESSNDVTGSCYWIKTPTKQILLECGLYQASKGSLLEQYKINSAKFPFKPKEIDYIIIGHNHIDHNGLLPRLYAQGCNAKIIVPTDNTKIAKILLDDCAFINGRESEIMTNKLGRQYSPLYTMDDVKNCLKHYVEYPFSEEIQLDKDVKIKFIPSGHILNAAQVILSLYDGTCFKKVGYTSDLGNTSVQQYYVNNFEEINQCQVLIGETTYARDKNDLTQKRRNSDLEKIKSVITETCIERKGRVLIPCFANQRMQSIITYLYDMFGEDDTFDIPILVDSPMAVKITKLYEDILNDEQLEKFQKVLAWKNIVYVEEYADSKMWMESKKPLVVCASSGMLTGGRSVSWLGNILGHQEDFILFVGYSSDGSLGWKIKHGTHKYISVAGKAIPNKCGIADLHSFSSHMQRRQLLDYYSTVKAEKVILVHGEMDGKIEFATDLQNAISKNNLTTRVIVANKGYVLTL